MAAEVKGRKGFSPPKVHTVGENSTHIFIGTTYSYRVSREVLRDIAEECAVEFVYDKDWPGAGHQEYRLNGDECELEAKALMQMTRVKDHSQYGIMFRMDRSVCTDAISLGFELAGGLRQEDFCANLSTPCAICEVSCAEFDILVLEFDTESG